MARRPGAAGPAGRAPFSPRSGAATASESAVPRRAAGRAPHVLVNSIFAVHASQQGALERYQK